jgi:hypothetical protein
MAFYAARVADADEQTPLVKRVHKKTSRVGETLALTLASLGALLLMVTAVKTRAFPSLLGWV